MSDRLFRSGDRLQAASLNQLSAARSGWMQYSLTFPYEEPGPWELPAYGLRAGKILGFDGSGDPIMLDPTSGVTDMVIATGSVTARSVQDRFGEWKNVKDFGAVGDGTTDDIVAIQAAQDAITSATGGILYFPPGRYKISAPIVINRHGVTVQGCGRGQNNAIGSQIVTSGGHDGFQVGEFFFFTIRDISINGPNGSVTSTPSALLRLTRATNALISNVHMLFGWDFIVLDGVVSANIENVTLSNSVSDGSGASHGILLTDAALRQCSNIRARGLSLAGFTNPANSYGIRSFGGSTLYWSQCAITTWGTGISLEPRSTGATWPEFFRWANVELEHNDIGWVITSGTRMTHVDCQVALSDAGSGWVIGSVNTGQYEFIGCKAINNQEHGFVFFPTGSQNSSAQLTGCVAAGNGQAAANTYSGLTNAGFNNMTITGGVYGGGGYATHPGVTSQKYGIEITASGTLGTTIVGATLLGNATAPFATAVTSGPARATITGCRGYDPGQQLPTYTVATLPAAASNARAMVYVSDETGGAVPAFSTGVNWLRVSDRAIVS